MNKSGRLVWVLLLCAALLWLTGCFGAATPMVKRERGPSGQQLPKNAIDPAFIKVGETTRDQVRSKLEMIDTGVDDPQFFWGRWASSKWGYVVAAGGYGAGAGDAGRVWSIHNLLVTFDEQGVARSSLLADDDQSFWRDLEQQIRNMPPVTFESLTIGFEQYGHYEVSFARDGIEVQRPYGKVRKARFATEKIVRLSRTIPQDKRNNPSSSCHVMHLREKSEVGQKITFCANALDLVKVFRYLQQYGPPEMKWE